MIKLIRDDETTFSNQGRDERRVGGKAHGTDEGIFRADELGNKGLANGMEVTRTTGKASATGGNTVSLDRLFDGISTPASGLGKAEVIVRRDVEGAGAGASEVLGVVVVWGDTVQENDGTTSDSGGGLGEALVEAGFETAGIERVKVRVERCVALEGRRQSEKKQ